MQVMVIVGWLMMGCCCVYLGWRQGKRTPAAAGWLFPIFSACGIMTVIIDKFVIGQQSTDFLIMMLLAWAVMGIVAEISAHR